MGKSLILILLGLVSISVSTVASRRPRERLTRLHFYIHDIPTAAKPTAVPVAQAATTNSSATLFGQVFVVDDSMTETSDPKSKPVGRAQGMYVFASQSEVSMSIYLNLVFTNAKYNGSKISFTGQNPLAAPVRELPIVGGTGYFRFARGYVEFRTVEFDPKIGNAILDVRVFAIHY